VNLIEGAYFLADDCVTGTSLFSFNDILQYYYAYDEKMLGHGYNPVT